MNTDIFLALDGGGTKTLCLIADAEGHILGYGTGGGANANLVPAEVARASMLGAVQEAWTASGLSSQRGRLAAISGPTGERSPDIVADVTGIVDAIRVGESDAAWASVRPWVARDYGLDLDVAVMVDSGTGSTSGGRNRDGRKVTVGGWGWLLGDEGSGFWIGRQAVRAAIFAEDGRGAPTALPRAICAALALRELHDLVPLIYQGPQGRRPIAGLAPLVVEVARQGDTVARQILAAAGRELAAMACAVIRHLDIAAEIFAVVPFGSVFKAGDLILDTFRAGILQEAAGARFVFPRYESVVGTLLSAMAHAGIAPADVWARMEAELAQLPRLLVQAPVDGGVSGKG